MRLEVNGLTHRFGTRLAVDGVALSAGAGEIVGLVGRNGAGKTTTMRGIMGILQPQAGEIRWDGRPVTAADRLRFGYMPEERGLYPQMRALDQVAYFGELHGLHRDVAVRKARAWLERLGLRERAQDKVIALSHGNQQRVQLAVALVFEPDLLVLDEPFAGLDPSAVDDLAAVLRAASGAAVLFSSHQLDLVERICDRVVILEEGRVLAAGTLPELQARLPRRLRVDVDAAAGWAGALPGVHPETGGLLRLDAGADAQAVLRAALAAGPVERFGWEAPSLSEVYRELVKR